MDGQRAIPGPERGALPSPCLFSKGSVLVCKPTRSSMLRTRGRRRRELMLTRHCSQPILAQPKLLRRWIRQFNEPVVGKSEYADFGLDRSLSAASTDGEL